MVDNLRFFAGAARVMEGKAANEYMAGHTSMIRREPVGVVASIAPWNYPLMMAGWKIGPALAAGNTVVLKPSARTPLTAVVLAEIAAGILPPGVLNVITGTGAAIGDALVAHPGVGMISVTGDTDTGKHIARTAADRVKRLHLELGGKAPVIVFDDADLDAVAETIKLFGYWNSGQDCTAACRVIVGPKVYDKFVAKLADQVSSIKWGDPAEGDHIEMGSLIAGAQADKVEGMVERAKSGAEVVAGGHRPTRVGDRRPGPAQRDRPGRGLRSGGHGPAIQRRGAGHRLGERCPLRPGCLGLVGRCRQGPPGRQGDPVRDGLDQRPLHARLGDAPRRLQGVGLRQ
jgi:acyl-CoA reductase-like NAD-dependent aldehyde dehydrogenase